MGITTLPDRPMNQRKFKRKKQFTGLCALLSCIATVIMSGFCIATLAISQADQKRELVTLKLLNDAVASVTEAAHAMDGQTIAWNALILHSGGGLKERSVLRSAFAQQSRAAAEAMELLLQRGRTAALPLENAEAAEAAFASANEALGERMTELRTMAGETQTLDALRAIDRSVKPMLNQASFQIESVAKVWSETAAARGTEFVSQSVASMGRMKAWLEILTLITTTLVIATAVLAVRSKEGAGNDRT